MMMASGGPRNFPNNLLTRIHGAFSTSVAPPRLEINRKTIEKTWKLMDKVIIVVGNNSGHLITTSSKFSLKQKRLSCD